MPGTDLPVDGAAVCDSVSRAPGLPRRDRDRRALSHRARQAFRDRLRGFLTERPDGSQVDVSTDEEADEGYVAPPLNGVWATAPYLHNGSVPAIDDLLDYESRVERIDAGAYAWTADPQSYDHERVGLAARFVDRDEADRREGDHRVHDSRRRGAGADGHEFGAALSASERRAVVEYLKTL